ncbi:MAG: low molecular weight phosphotyrosine protein phosphatase [Burkholderiales bacterium]|nr:low molecular weight phosphotyrosine protein phosphatase [Burkholderiales bacterium]
MTVLTVICTANICRSPMGQVILQHKARQAGFDVEVRSAGVQALVGRGPDKEALGALTRAGYELPDGKRAEQLLVPNASASQLMLVMENRHKQWVMQNFPAHSGKVWLMGHWLGQSEVEDPIGQGPAEFDSCLKTLEKAVESWLPKLRVIL